MVKEAADGNYRQAHGLWVPSGQTLLYVVGAALAAMGLARAHFAAKAAPTRCAAYLMVPLT
ncbi:MULTISPECIES: hypothetical protein [Pseudomonas]|uniref:hypothetical protein n=1 Tax=Pseudomonas TaxID=286 RepID=UPI001C7FBC59|nr:MULTISPECIES: hypothetical protein [Pseudomonas]MDH0603868.1 hypothetical protein [Pseudomonas sp. GD03869]